jgi:hypothetical protein
VIIGDHLRPVNSNRNRGQTSAPAPATTTSVDFGKRFRLVVNISGYAFGYASLKRRTLRKAEGHAARQFIYYEKKDVNPRTSSGEAIRSNDFGSDDKLYEKQMICLLIVLPV